MKHVFIVNPVSGKTDAGKNMIPKIMEAAKQQNIPVEIEATQAPKHAVAIARSYAETGEPVRLYAVGGDGTLNEVLEGAYESENAQVACIPVGSGNDFVRNFPSSYNFLDISAQMAGEAITIDLMRVDNGICAAITSAGLDAEVAYGIPKYRRIPLLGGTMAYNISIVERLLSRLGREMEIEIDGGKICGKYLIATVCNGKTYGGGYCAAPVADMQDGMLEIILVKKISRLRIAGVIGKYKKGAHFKNGEIVPELRDIISHYRGKSVQVKPADGKKFILNVDGECGPASRLFAQVIPNAARFVLPAAAAPG